MCSGPRRDIRSDTRSGTHGHEAKHHTTTDRLSINQSVSQSHTLWSSRPQERARWSREYEDEREATDLARPARLHGVVADSVADRTQFLRAHGTRCTSPVHPHRMCSGVQAEHPSLLTRPLQAHVALAHGPCDAGKPSGACPRTSPFTGSTSVMPCLWRSIQI